MNRISLLLQKPEMEAKTSVNNKDILQVLWGSIGFNPRALIYHVFIMECLYVIKQFFVQNVYWGITL